MTAAQQINSNALEVALLTLNLTRPALAVRCGMDRRTLSNQLALPRPARRYQIQIENSLGRAIWSELSEFEEHQAITQRLGFDLRLASKSMLRACALGRGLPVRINDRKQTIAEKLQASLAAESAPKQPKERKHVKTIKSAS